MPLTTEEVRNLIDRNDELKSTRLLYQPLWEELATYILPKRLGPWWGYGLGQKQTTKQFDSTAEHESSKLSAIMHGTLTPTASIWSSFKFRDERINHLKSVMDWLEASAISLCVRRHQSNFASEMHELYLDLPVFGAGCLFIEERNFQVPGFNGFRYKALSNMEYCTSENSEGMVDTLFREFDLSARAAIEKFGEEVGEKITKEAEKKPDTKFKFIHAVFPNPENNGKPFASYYLSVDEKKVVGNGGYYEFPFIVVRWSKTSGEDYGRGPGHTALPDVRTLNKAKEFGLKAWAKDLDPPTFEKDQGVIGSLKLVPGGRNIVKDKESIWVMDHKIRYDVSQIKEEELRRSIARIFYADQLQLPEKSDMREMEVAVRYELMQRILGPTIGRFETEGLNPLIKREMGLLFRANSNRYPTLPPFPEILLEMGINQFDIEYEGPLAKAQRYSETGRIQKVFNFAGAIQPVYPDIFDNFDGDKTIRLMSELEGVPSEIQTSDEERAVIRERKAKIRAAEQKKQDLERLAAGVKDAAPALQAITGFIGEAKGEGEGAKA